MSPSMKAFSLEGSLSGVFLILSCLLNGVKSAPKSWATAESGVFSNGASSRSFSASSYNVMVSIIFDFIAAWGYLHSPGPSSSRDEFSFRIVMT